MGYSESKYKICPRVTLCLKCHDSITLLSLLAGRPPGMGSIRRMVSANTDFGFHARNFALHAAARTLPHPP